MKKYNVEKVLYFANTECGFNVSINERKDRRGDFKSTTIESIVNQCLGQGLIVEVARDDVDVYYRTTRAGEICLLEMQIQWRRANGKCISEHKARLMELSK